MVQRCAARFVLGRHSDTSLVTDLCYVVSSECLGHRCSVSCLVTFYKLKPPLRLSLSPYLCRPESTPWKPTSTPGALCHWGIQKDFSLKTIRLSTALPVLSAYQSSLSFQVCSIISTLSNLASIMPLTCTLISLHSLCTPALPTSHATSTVFQTVLCTHSDSDSDSNIL